jgi:branched-chain amino acid transport system ATP-binding protein
MLEVDGVTKRFGGLTAVDNVSFDIDEGEIVGLIGPNGAGKTTLFNLISGLLDPDVGSIRFQDSPISGHRPYRIAKAGIMRTYQTAKTFGESTVLDNVVVGVVFGRRSRLSRATAEAKAEEYLKFIELGDKRDHPASELTVADRKLLELGRGLAANPDLLLVDEIASGLTPTEIDSLTEKLEEVRSEFDVAVFWTEHVVDAIMGTVDWIIGLDKGQVIATGRPEEIREDKALREAYLGVDT